MHQTLKSLLVAKWQEANLPEHKQISSAEISAKMSECQNEKSCHLSCLDSCHDEKLWTDLVLLLFYTVLLQLCC